MKVNELIKKLNEIPAERRDDEIEIYVNGRISGLLDISTDLWIDEDVIAIQGYAG